MSPDPTAGLLADVPEAAYFAVRDGASLSVAELARYRDKGWVGVYPLLTQEGVARACRVREQTLQEFTGPDRFAEAQHPQAFERRPWFKSMHAYVPDYYDVACHPAIVKRVSSILGPDVIAWGLTLVCSRPGGIHRWHVDVEHRYWDGVSVYIGLENIGLQSSLKVVEGSQRIPEPPQALGVANDDAQALAAAQSRVPEASLVTVPLAPGQFFIFAGRIWHGSHNTSGLARVAMIIHYSRPDARVQVPLNFDDPVRWHASRPPCVLVAGRDDHGVNRLAGRPGTGGPR